jgi:hypothetical protein
MPVHCYSFIIKIHSNSNVMICFIWQFSDSENKINTLPPAAEVNHQTGRQAGLRSSTGAQQGSSKRSHSSARMWRNCRSWWIARSTCQHGMERGRATDEPPYTMNRVFYMWYRKKVLGLVCNQIINSTVTPSGLLIFVVLDNNSLQNTIFSVIFYQNKLVKPNKSTILLYYSSR